jgi:predicted DNA-binding protein with PD1-like motif/glutaredoxin
MPHQALRSVALHLEPGSDVRRSLEQLAIEENASGFVLSVVGNLSQAAFQCPGKAQPTVLSGLLEIITLQGTVGPQGVHLHLSLSDSHCQVWGGHLEPGTLVHSGADLLVGFTAPSPLAAAGAPALASAAAAATTGAVAATSGPARRDRHGVRQASAPAAEPRVQIGVREGCPWSARALRLLRTLSIPFVLVEPVAGSSVPQVSIDGVAIGGYDALADLHGRGELEALRQA